MITICRNDLYANVTVPIKGWALIEPAGYRWVTNNRVYIIMFSLCLCLCLCLSLSPSPHTVLYLLQIKKKKLFCCYVKKEDTSV